MPPGVPIDHARLNSVKGFPLSRFNFPLIQQLLGANLLRVCFLPRHRPRAPPRRGNGRKLLQYLPTQVTVHAEAPRALARDEPCVETSVPGARPLDSPAEGRLGHRCRPLFKEPSPPGASDPFPELFLVRHCASGAGPRRLSELVPPTAPAGNNERRGERSPEENDALSGGSCNRVAGTQLRGHTEPLDDT